MALKIIFYILIFILFYIYFGYPILLFLINLITKKKKCLINEAYLPDVSLVIAAYNEEVVIEGKINNSLELDYPKDKLEIIVFSDASKAVRELHWTAKRDLVDMCRDAWRFEENYTTQKNGLTLATKHNNRNYINANI